MRFTLVWLCLILCACGQASSSNQNAEPASDTLRQSISGNAVKGVIVNGLVSAYLVASGQRELMGQTRTNNMGQFELALEPKPEQPGGAPLILLEVTGGQGASMRCDLTAGCVSTLTGDKIGFGQSLPLADDFILLGTVAANDHRQAFISPLSHVTITTAAQLPGGLTQSNIAIASGWVAQTFGLAADPLATETPDITSLSAQSDLNEQQLKQAIVGASFFDLVTTDPWRQGELNLDVLPLKDIFQLQAELAQQLAEQLAPTQSQYASALAAISSDAQASYTELLGNPLRITGQPLSVTVTEGESFVLHVAVTGDGPVSYQWRKNGVDLVGATLSNYGKANASPADIGSYSVRVSNSSGETNESLAALVLVNKLAAPVSIVQQPQSQAITEGDSFSLSVAVTGDGPFSYQWQKAGSLIPGATQSSYTVTSSTEANAGSYRVTITNTAGVTTSDFANVVVTALVSPVVLVQQPQSMVATVGASAGFRVDATGGGFISYQWYKDGVALPGAYGNSFSLAAASMNDAGKYYVTVSNSRGSVTSSLASLTILANEVPVAITKQPQSLVLYEGQVGALTISATGDGALTYQWRLDGKDLIGANQASYVISNAQYADAGSYTVEVRNTYSTATSLSALVTVKVMPALELSWDIPTQREDGSPLELYEIDGYVIEYGYAPSNMTGRIAINDGATTNYQLADQISGTVYFRIATIDVAGLQGKFSDTLVAKIE